MNSKIRSLLEQYKFIGINITNFVEALFVEEDNNIIDFSSTYREDWVVGKWAIFKNKSFLYVLKEIKLDEIWLAKEIDQQNNPIWMIQQF